LGCLPLWGREGVTLAIPLMSLSEEFQQSVTINKNILAPPYIRDVMWLGTLSYSDIFPAFSVNQRSCVFLRSKIFSQPDQATAGRIH